MKKKPQLMLGVVAEDNLQQHRLRSALADFGCAVVSLSAERCTTDELRKTPVAAWLVDLREDHHLLDGFSELDVPVLFGFEAAPSPQASAYPRWEKRFYTKLKNLLGADVMRQAITEGELNELVVDNTAAPRDLPAAIQKAAVGESARYVWLLGASLGGPGAVKRFLDCLPPGFPVGFIYGQHIDQNFVPVLAQVLGRHASIHMQQASEGFVLHNGQVLIAPTDVEITFSAGQLVIKQQAWPGPYGPSVDQLMLNVHQAYPHAGFIIFSGMGNDGAEAAHYLKDKNVQIWAQNAETCASSAMPDSVRETGAVNFSGSPEELAAQLIRHIESLEKQVNRTGLCNN